MGVFWGLRPGDEALARLVVLERPVLEGVAWEPPERLHVTVRYFGELDDGLAARLVELTPALAGAVPSLRIELGPATERLGRDGTLVVPARGAEVLARACDELLEAQGLGARLAGREHPFYGHLTLARRRRGAAIPVELLGRDVSVGFAPACLELISSEHGPGGRRYRVLESADFAGQDAGGEGSAR